MVKRSSGSLDLVFHALADPTRRQMLRTLARGDRHVADLARPHAVSAPAISKHLKTLERAGLVRRMRDGRFQLVQLRTAPLRRAARWLAFYEQSWPANLENLEQLVEPRRR